MREEKENFRGQTDILPEFFFGARRLRRNERVMACERNKSLEVSTKMSFLSPSVFAFETKRDRVLASSSLPADGVDRSNFAVRNERRVAIGSRPTQYWKAG